MSQDTPLRILLIEDNPGDVRYLEEMIRDADHRSEQSAADITGSERAGSGTAVYDSYELIHESELSDGLDQLASREFDIVLLDLNLPDSEGVSTVSTLSEQNESVPIVVLTGVQDRAMGTEALRHGAEEYLVKDEITPELLIRSIFHAIERMRRDQQLERQRTQLKTLNALNQLVHEISQLVIESSNRDEIEQLVCDQLANSDACCFAWIGEVDRDYRTITVRSQAETEYSFPTIPIELDIGDKPHGPIGKAIHSSEVTVGTAATASDKDIAMEERLQEPIQSSLIIPIEHEAVCYGVLAVYRRDPDAFSADERTIIGRLGDLVGLAVNAIERKQALMSEEVVEVSFQIESIFEDIEEASQIEGEVSFDRAIPVSDGDYLEYGTVTADAVDLLSTLVERLDYFDSATLLDEEGDIRRFELRLTEPSALATVASVGGRVASAVIAEGDFQMVVLVPPSVDVRSVVDAVKTVYPDATVTARRNTTRSTEPAAELESALIGELTDKQQKSLEAAYFAGFFEWPRDSSGEDVADAMGVSPSTFHQHVRAAEEKLLGALFKQDWPRQ